MANAEGAYFDPDLFAVNAAGDVLSFVVARGSIPDDRCYVTGPSAMVWISHDGTRRAFSSGARPIATAEHGGFVVGAQRRPCANAAEHPDAGGAYMVTAAGDTVHIRWPSGAQGSRTRAVCAYVPDDERCAFSATDATAHLLPPAPGGPTGHAHRVPAGVLLDYSFRGKHLWWSTDDGKGWHHRLTPLAKMKGPDGRVPSFISSIGYDRTTVMGTYTDAGVDFSLDRGRTWTVRRIPAQLPEGLRGPLREVYVTGSGALLGLAPTVHGQGEQLVTSSDAAWSHLVATPIRTTHIPLWVMIHGDIVNVVNPDVTDLAKPTPWWISTDAGSHWRRNDLLPTGRGPNP